MKTKLFQTTVAWAVFLFGMSAMLWSVEAGQEHLHKTRDLRHYAARIVDVKNGEIYFTDLESEPGVVLIQHAFVDKEFRLVKMREGKGGIGTFEVLALGALQDSKGILTICTECGRAVGMRCGDINFYKSEKE